MTIPLLDPLFWDPTRVTGDYAVVDQEDRHYLLRPGTGRVIARLRPPMGGGDPLGMLNRDPNTRESDLKLQAHPGWPFLPGDGVTTTPVVDDLDGDGVMEVAFATRTGWLWLLNPDGRPRVGWPVPLGADCYCSPALGDLDDDGKLDVVVGDVNGRVHVVRFDGHPVPGWPAEIPGACDLPGIYGSVVIADLDADGRQEVIATQAEGRVCVFRANGRTKAGWPVATLGADDPPNAGTLFNRVAVGDLDRDGRLEVVASANDYRIYVWDSAGRPRVGWPKVLENHGRAGYADPVLADLDGDDRTEILVATDQGFEGPARVYAFNAQGATVGNWPADLQRRCNAGVAVGDLDHDGDPEVVAATVGENSLVYCWNSRGRPRPGFPVHLGGMSINASPILTDVDGDAEVDILLSATGTTFEPATILMALNAYGRRIRPFPIRLDGCEVVENGCCAADLDGDGRFELLTGTEVQGQLLVWDLAGRIGPTTGPWPKPGFDRSNSGEYHPTRSLPRVEPPKEDEADLIHGPPRSTPFSPLVSVSFVLLEEGHVTLTVLDVVGDPIRVLLNGVLPIGSYSISWDGTDGRGRSIPPGVYFYELETPDRRATGQLLLLR